MRLFLWIGVAALLSAQEVPDAMLGRWRTTTVTKGGVGALYEFKTGGVVFIRPSAIVDGTYKVEGNDLVLPPLVENGPPNRLTMQVAGPGQIKFYKGEVLSMELSRVGKNPPGKPNILGEWVGMRLMDGQKMEMRMFFYPAGRSMFLLPFSTQQAKYAVSSGRMTIVLPDGKSVEGPFVLSGSALTVPNVRAGQTTKLKRY